MVQDAFDYVGSDLKRSHTAGGGPAKVVDAPIGHGFGYLAAKEAHAQALVQAQGAYDREYKVFVEERDAFYDAFRRIAARDGDDVAMHILGRRVGDLSGYDAQSVIQMQIEAIRQNVSSKVAAETGLKLPDVPTRAADRVAAAAPQEPLEKCSEDLARLRLEAGIVDWDFSEALENVLRTHGPAKYEKLIGAPVIP